VDDLNGQSPGFRMLHELGAHYILLPDQKNSNVILPCGKNRALNFRLRGAVRTHGVNRDGYWHCP